MIAHNYAFDGSCLYRELGYAKQPFACTFGLFAQLANDSKEIKWGLKYAMENVLGWEETNTALLDEWLAKHHNKDKSMMSHAPFYILGPYNALDAGATWQLYIYFRSIMAHFDWGPALWSYHQQDHCLEIALLIEQQHKGWYMDVEKMQAYHDSLEERIKAAERAFLIHPKIEPLVDEYNEQILAEYRAKEPRHKTKKGAVSKNWIKWDAKYMSILRANHFNIGSPKQLTWLLYEKLGFPVLVKTDTDAPSVGKKAYPGFGELGKLLKAYKLVIKEGQSTEAALYLERDGKVHPDVKSVSAVSGRLGSGKEEE